MGLLRAACSKTPQSQGTDAKQAQLQAEFKVRHTDDYYYYAALKLIILILNMIKPNSHYSRGHKERSTQPGLDMSNKEEPTTAAQPQGWANLYKVTEEKARYARAYTVDSEQVKSQLQASYAKNDYYHDALKLLKHKGAHG